VQALQGLAMLNQQAVPAVGDVLEALKDSDASVRQQAVHALQNIPAKAEDVLPALTKLFKEEKGQQPRISIVQTLQRYGPKAMPLLLEAIKDSDATIRQQAVWSMQNTGGDLSPYATESIALVKDPDANVRVNVINILGRTGEKGVLYLGELLGDPNEQVRWTAAAALQGTG